ncbi:hypothetical protein KGY71_08205 [Candidatus Bipolaricaulota bacterium]|nr:hypothetical protein [Candidatus Bipolaricaulota bacterium]
MILTDIRVNKEEENENGNLFSVEVSKGDSISNHRVTLESKDFKRLAPSGVSEKSLIEESFRFLLEREPKESILSSFDLTVISNYFPEYEKEIKNRLENQTG